MRLISDQIGLKDSSAETFYLDTGNASSREGAVMMTSKTTPEIKRVIKPELEQTYLSNPVIFNIVNKTTEVIMSAGWKLIGDKDTVEYFSQWLESIGNSGGELEWESLLERNFQHCFIFGDAWNELIYNKGKTQLLDLDTIDPKKMDYAKNGSMKIALDKNSNPLGYVEKLPFDVTVTTKIKPPEGVSLNMNEIFLPPDRIAHYKLYTVGDGFYGIGLIEPVYNTSFRKMKMEQALSNSWWRTGFPLLKGTVGDINHEPTEEHLTKMALKLADMDYRSSITLPNYANVEILEAKKPEKLKEQLNYFIDQEVAGSGMPKAFATGSGEATNRATLGRQEYLLKMSLKNVVKRVTSVIEKKIFARKAELEGLDSYPRIRWGEIALEELDSKAARIVKYAQVGLIKPDAAIERFIRKVEDLPESDVGDG
jgi:hypothetical protein